MPKAKKSLKETHPNLVDEWDFNKNDLSIEDVSYGSKKKVWWLCFKGHSYEARIDTRTLQKSGCLLCYKNRAKNNGEDLLSKFPEIAKEWDYARNTLKPYEVSFGSQKKVWWLCSKKHSYQTVVYSRTNLNMKSGCPYCSNQKVGYGNDFLSTHPKLAKEWDFDKNSLKPDQVTYSSNKKIWWICDKRHSYNSMLNSRTNLNLNSGCPYCAGKKIGYGNDLKTKLPEIARQWDYSKNKLKPDKVTSNSDKKVWWICDIGHSFNATIANRTPPKNTGCPYCKITPRSKEEIYLLFELKKFFMIDEGDHKIKINKIYDVDIKLKNEKLIIEYDGSYWHKDKAEKDMDKTKVLQNAGWTVLRVREKPLKILNPTYNISSKPVDYKETSNKVLKKIAELGYEVKNLDKYLSKEKLTNKKAADLYMKKLLDERESKKKLT